MRCKGSLLLPCCGLPDCTFGAPPESAEHVAVPQLEKENGGDGFRSSLDLPPAKHLQHGFRPVGRVLAVEALRGKVPYSVPLHFGTDQPRVFVY